MSNGRVYTADAVPGRIGLLIRSRSKHKLQDKSAPVPTLLLVAFRPKPLTVVTIHKEHALFSRLIVIMHGIQQPSRGLKQDFLVMCSVEKIEQHIGD